MNTPYFAPAAAPPYSLDALPLQNSFARLPEPHYTRLLPKPLPAPYKVAVSDEVAALIGLAPAELQRPEFVEIFAGNRLLPGSEPLAAVYSGHQFGMWAGRLGDGRAHLLGEVRHGGGAWELQLKGAGQTPYSRGADGRAVLRSSIREFLCSEAMAALGVPTTRALCIIGSDQPIRREGFETAAVVTRVAPSFVRFGSFEHWSARQQYGELKELADYVIQRFRPELLVTKDPYAALLGDVAKRTGEMIAHWMAVGFMHGVMNTDNMSILGLTLDYGPFGFMDTFDAGHICNHSDDHGRYAWRAQPGVAQWNLYALAEALLPLIGDVEVAKSTVDEAFTAAYNSGFQSRLRAKLGFTTEQPEDEDFIHETFALLQGHRQDFTLFFRRLSGLPGVAAASSADAALRDHFVDRGACDLWLEKWRARLAREHSADAQRQPAMAAVNPKYILRNWIAESAIQKAQTKDYSALEQVLRCLRRPFDEQAEFERFSAPPPDWASGLSVSCSS